MAGALASNWLARVMVSSINAFECAVRTTRGLRTAARKGEKIDHLASHVVFEYALDRAPSSITRSLNTMAMCGFWTPSPLRAAPARVTHNNSKACFMLVLATSPLALHVAQMACFCQCQPAARMQLSRLRISRPSVQTWGKI